MEIVFSFLRELKLNNNREWFNVHKDRYEGAKLEFEEFCTKLISRIAVLDPDFKNLEIKDCLFRIYRDIRFSHDKTPYKTHFGAYMAYPGGRKSQRCGYYLHFEPDGKSFFSAGVWSPAPNVLKALRRSIYENFEEFNAIRNESNFTRSFGNSFYEEDKLKRMPAGFPSDFNDPEILKLKHYLVSHDLTDNDVLDVHLLEKLDELVRHAFPLNEFLNFAIDEMVF